MIKGVFNSCGIFLNVSVNGEILIKGPENHGSKRTELINVVLLINYGVAG